MKSFAVLIAGLAMSTQLFAVCSSKQQQFEIRQNGTVYDKQTQLMWMQCSLGMEWKNGACLGPALKYDWKNSIYSVNIFNDVTAPGGYSDWRLPTIDELKTLVVPGCINPAIDEKAFPNTMSSGYWSVTELENYQLGAYLLYFLHGKDYLSNKQAEWYVRLVRNP